MIRNKELEDLDFSEIRSKLWYNPKDDLVFDQLTNDLHDCDDVDDIGDDTFIIRVRNFKELQETINLILDDFI